MFYQAVVTTIQTKLAGRERCQLPACRFRSRPTRTRNQSSSLGPRSSWALPRLGLAVNCLSGSSVPGLALSLPLIFQPPLTRSSLFRLPLRGPNLLPPLLGVKRTQVCFVCKFLHTEISANKLPALALQGSEGWRAIPDSHCACMHRRTPALEKPSISKE